MSKTECALHAGLCLDPEGEAVTTVQEVRRAPEQELSDAEPEIGFPGGLKVEVQAISENRWRVLTAFEYRASNETYIVPAGEETDFASVPRIFVWLIPKYGRYTKAAILHDRLCRLSREGSFSRRDADGIFRQAMRTLDVAFLRRWIMWAAVRWGALFTPEGRQDWLKDAWIVVPLTLIVLPVVAPAALLILVTLFVGFIAELIVWPELALVRVVQRRRQMRIKRVNVPQFTFRM